MGENRLLGTDEPVEFEIQPVEVEDLRGITGHFRRICGICLHVIKKAVGFQHVTGWSWEQ
jgi:hypothetical protein